MQLGDYTRVSDGKLDILGGGWVVTGPGPSAFGVGITVVHDHGEFGQNHRFRLELVDEDGQLVMAPDGKQPILRLDGNMETSEPPDHQPGLPIVQCVALNLNGAPLPTGRRLEFRLWLDGGTKDTWTLPFWTRPPEAMAEAA